MKKFFTSLTLGIILFLNGWLIAYGALVDNSRAVYLFNSGALTTDSVAGTYTLTNVNTVGETASGKIGYGADFGATNTDKAFRRNDNLGFGYGDACSFSFWFKAASEKGAGVSETVLNQFIGLNPGIYTRIVLNYDATPANDTIQFAGATASLTKTGAIGTEWHHIVFTFDGTTYTYYVDNESIGTTGYSPENYSAYGTWFSIGQYYATGINSQYFSGLVDEVYVWARELTSDEVDTLFNDCQYPFTDECATPSVSSIVSDFILFE